MIRWVRVTPLNFDHNPNVLEYWIDAEALQRVSRERWRSQGKDHERTVLVFTTGMKLDVTEPVAHFMQETAA